MISSPNNANAHKTPSWLNQPPFGSSWLIGFALWMSAAVLPTAVLAANHGAALFKNVIGPDGTPRAHVGDTVTASIRVQSLDGLGDSLTITNIMDTVHHFSGDITSPNLLQGPRTLTNLNDHIDVVHIYSVLAGDGNLINLVDNAFAGGFDNHDGPGGTHLLQNFQISFPGQIQILKPCISVATSCANPQPGPPGVVTYVGSVTNCGNAPLADVVVSNAVNGAFVHVLGPTSLDVNQGIAFTNSYAPANPCQPSEHTLWASGTDELGLRVSSTSGPFTCFNPSGANSVRLTIMQRGADVILSWPQACGIYAPERSSDLVTWTAAPGTVFPVGPDYNLTNAVSGAFFFYRLRK